MALAIAPVTVAVAHRADVRLIPLLLVLALPRNAETPLIARPWLVSQIRRYGVGVCRKAHPGRAIRISLIVLSVIEPD
jgi:hypothetical protein